MSKIQTIQYPNNKTFAMFNVPKLRCETYSKKKEIGTKEKTEIALSALSAAIVPVVIFNSFKQGRIDKIVNSFKNNLPFKEKFKAVWDMFEIENYAQILLTTLGGISGGLISGLKYANTKKDKEAKYKEGVFEFLNNMIPTTLVATGLKVAEKYKKSKSILLQAGIILTSVIGGMFIANKASNKINEKIFDKNKEHKDQRNFKPTDCLVHIDDLVNLAVLVRIPFASKFQVDKLLPLIYARTGYEVGVAGSKKD